MDSSHDPLRHLRYLRQSLSQDNESIGFFISAGCPLSVPMEDGKWPLIPDVANLTKYVNSQLEADIDYIKFLEELEKSGRNKENIEEILSFLRMLLSVSVGGDVRGLNQIQIEGIERKICSLISAKIDVNLPNDETPYHYFGKWIRSIDRKNAIEIFTTNYDLLLEQALEDLEIPYFDGFVGARRPFVDLRAIEDNLIPSHWVRLWKIHGSINWRMENAGPKRYVYRVSSIDPNNVNMIYPSHLKYEESRKMPYLALMDQLNRFLRKKSSFLVMAGYSFNDGHINDLIISALKSNPSGMVVALMYGKFEDENNPLKYKEAFRLAKNQHNLNIWFDDCAVIGTVKGLWVKNPRNEDHDERITALVNHDSAENRYSVKLGDFLNFTQFLVRIIGADEES